MNKKGNGSIETIIATILLFVIIGILFSSGAVITIIEAFSIPELGFWGPILGILFFLALVLGIGSRLLGR